VDQERYQLQLCTIHASDIKWWQWPFKKVLQGAIRITQSNASRAGVLNYIQVESCAFTKHPWLSHPSNTPPKLLLALNVPFRQWISRMTTNEPLNYF
jgi:hypothetical protein